MLNYVQQHIVQEFDIKQVKEVLTDQRKFFIKYYEQSWIEHDPETIRVIVQAFSLAIRKVERESVIKSPEGYVFTSVYKALANHFQEFH